MKEILLIVGVILFVALVIWFFVWLVFLPRKIVSKKTPATVGWTIATVATGIIPGIIAALLFRYKDERQGQIFTFDVRRRID